MNKLLILLLFNSTSFGASSGSLTVSGSVSVINNITINANGANNTTLNIVAGETNKNIASVDEQSNNAAGYKIMAYSTNSSQLVHSSDNTKLTSYQISYDGGSYVTLSNSASPVQLKNVSSLSSMTTDTSVVLINVTALSNAIAGLYQDIITFSIVAN